jgi:hypothetical protein
MFMQEILLSRKCIIGAAYVLITGKIWDKIILASETDGKFINGEILNGFHCKTIIPELKSGHQLVVL